MPDPFISQQDVVDYIGRGGTADPGMLIAVDAACDICRSVAEQSFNRGTATASFDGTGTDVLILPERPVNSAGTITVNGTAEADYMATDDGLLLRGTAGGFPRPVWPLGRQNITITYDYGYDEIPRDVRMVALSIASRLVIQGPAKRESIGDVTVDYATAATDLTAGERLILTKYRRTRSF